MQEHYLLSTDAIHVAAMNKEKVTHIASNDIGVTQNPLKKN